jgi:outer membrane protein assembly factor BamB
MPYETLKYNQNRITPPRNITLALSKRKVFESIYPFGFYVFSDYILGSAGPEGLYQIGLENLELEKFPIAEEMTGSILVATADRMIVKRRDPNDFFSFSPKTNHLQEVSIDPRVYTSNQALKIGEWILSTAKGEKRRSLIRLDSDFNIDVEFELGFFSSGFAVSQSNNEIVVIGNDGELACFDIARASELWRKGIDDLGVLHQPNDMSAVKSHVHIFDNLVICGYANLYIVALDLMSGELVWKQRLNGEVNFPCVDWRGRVYKVSNSDLVILDAKTGAKQVEQLIGIPPDLMNNGLDLSTAYCDVTESHLFGITPNGLLFAVNLATTELEWYDDTREMYGLGNPFVIDGNRLFLQTTLSHQLIVYEGQGGYKPEK